jgi:hypothetical protein
VLPSDPRILNELSRLVGAIVLYFGVFEATLQSTILAIHHGADERDPEDKRLPHDQFTVWTSFMRESVKHDGMGPFAERIVELMDEAERLAPKRNQLVHGYMSSYDEATQTFLFRKFNRQKVKDDLTDEVVEILGETPLPITLAELEAYGEQVHAMCIGLSELAPRMMEAFFGQTADVLDVTRPSQ